MLQWKTPTLVNYVANLFYDVAVAGALKSDILRHCKTICRWNFFFCHRMVDKSHEGQEKHYPETCKWGHTISKSKN